MREDVTVIVCPACEGKAVTRAGVAACTECWWVAGPEWVAEVKWPRGTVREREAPGLWVQPVPAPPSPHDSACSSAETLGRSLRNIQRERALHPGRTRT